MEECVDDSYRCAVAAVFVRQGLTEEKDESKESDKQKKRL